MEKFILSAHSSIEVDFECGALKNIIKNGRQITCGSAPLFTVKLRKKTSKSYVVNSTECKFISYGNNVASYTCGFFDAQVHFFVQDESLLAKICIQNKTQDLLEWTELLPFTVPQKLKDEDGGRGEILYPYNEGCRVTNMAFRESMPFSYTEPEYPSKGSFSIFPNMIFGQFIAYLDDGAGVYLAMHDSERTTKHVDFCYFQEGIKVFMRAFCDVTYGQDYEMPFNVTLRAFDGTWHSAADIYYNWFKDNLPMGAKKIKDNPDLPAWYHDYPLVVAYPVRPFLKSSLNLLQHCFCFYCFSVLASRHVGSELPDQGSNPHLLHRKVKSTSLTAGKSLQCLLSICAAKTYAFPQASFSN